MTMKALSIALTTILLAAAVAPRTDRFTNNPDPAQAGANCDITYDFAGTGLNSVSVTIELTGAQGQKSSTTTTITKGAGTTGSISVGVPVGAVLMTITDNSGNSSPHTTICT